MTRDLYISTFGPKLGTGRAQRTYTCIRALAMLGPVDLAYVPYDGDYPSPEYAAIQNVEFHPIHPSRRMGRATAYLAARARGVPKNLARGVSSELVSAADRLAAEPERGRVVVGDLSAAGALLTDGRRRRIIYNAHNVAPTYFDPTVPNTPWSRRALNAFERRMLRNASESWMVSRHDLQAARELAPTARLRYVPNAVDVEAITPVPASDRPRRSLLMVGDFLYPPNRTGRAMLVEEVMPIVWRQLSDVRLRIVGRGCEDWVSPDPRIEVAGFVEDLTAAYEAADCVIVPVTTGGGSPLKFIEALAYRVPVVATPFAARGLEVVAGTHYLQGSDGPSLAAAVLDVLGRGATEVAAAGRAIAQAEYSVRALARRIADSRQDH